MSTAKDFARRVLPTAMTVLGSLATIAAVIFAAKEGQEFKEKTEGKEMTKKQKVWTGVKTFKKTELCTAVSLGCSIGAHCLDLKMQASLVGAYTLLQSQVKKHQGEFGKYRKKIEEIYGPEVDEKAMVEVKKEELTEEEKNDDGDKLLTVHLYGFIDDLPEITIKATMEDLLRAEIAMNKQLITTYELTANDALGYFGIEPMEIVGARGNEYGWNADALCDWTGGYFWLENHRIKLDDGSWMVCPMFSAKDDFRNEDM